MDVLNLADADLKGFDAIPSGVYPAEVYEVTIKETKGGPGAKMPEGTPMWNVQFRIPDGHEYENRRFFRSLTIAPAQIDGKPYEHKKKMDGMIARFLMDIGYKEADVTGGKFKVDFEDMKGRPVGIVVKREQAYNTKPEDNEFQNSVSGTKPIDAVNLAGATSGIL